MVGFTHRAQCESIYRDWQSQSVDGRVPQDYTVSGKIVSAETGAQHGMVSAASS